MDKSPEQPESTSAACTHTSRDEPGWISPGGSGDYRPSICRDCGAVEFRWVEKSSNQS